jgi:vancomycin permeability regulator SanA
MRFGSTIMQKVRIVFWGAFTIYLVAALSIAMVGLRELAGSADLIVVPGNTIRPDGTPSDRLKARLDVAAALFKQHKAPRIFVSGGVGKEGFDEASSMAAYLVSIGIPSTAIVQDPAGVDTAATARNAAHYLQKNKQSKAIVATQFFHVARTALALRRAGIDVTGNSSAKYYELRDAYSLAREVPGYAAYWLSSQQPPLK